MSAHASVMPAPADVCTEKRTQRERERETHTDTHRDTHIHTETKRQRDRDGREKGNAYWPGRVPPGE